MQIHPVPSGDVPTGVRYKLALAFIALAVLITVSLIVLPNGSPEDIRVLGNVDPKLARRQARTPYVAQQLGMDLADQPHGNRQLLQPGQSVVHGTDVVGDLLDILRTVFVGEVGFGCQQVMQ